MGLPEWSSFVVRGKNVEKKRIDFLVKALENAKKELNSTKRVEKKFNIRATKSKYAMEDRRRYGICREVDSGFKAKPKISGEDSTRSTVL